MNKFYLSIAVAIALNFVYVISAKAACNQTGTTPGGGPVVVCNSNQPNPDPTAVQPATDLPIEVIVQSGAGINADIPNGAIRGGSGNNVISVFGSLNNPGDIVSNSNGQGIQSGTGDDVVKVMGGLVQSLGNRAIDLQGGDDSLHVEDARLFSLTNDAITGSSGNDHVIIKNSIIDGADGIALGNDNDEIMVELSTINTTSTSAGDPPIDGGKGNDQITVESSQLNSTSISAIKGNDGDDVITIKSGVVLNALIDCDDRDFNEPDEFFDTLVFAMEVPKSRISSITNRIENLPTPDGEITINGLFYEYINCDQIVADLRVAEPRPIPTLSEWGLITLSGLMGIAALFIMRMRKLA